MKTYTCILFANSKAWWAWPGRTLIKWVTGKKYSHCAILIRGDHDVDWVYESVFPVSRKIRFLDWHKKYDVYWVYTLVDEMGMENNLDPLVGMRYSIKQLLMIYAQIIFEKIGITVLFNNLNNNHLICSELIGIYLVNHHGVDFKESSDTLGLDEIEKALERLKTNGNISSY
jgi:hypothetical protein